MLSILRVYLSFSSLKLDVKLAEINIDSVESKKFNIFCYPFFVKSSLSILFILNKIVSNDRFFKFTILLILVYHLLQALLQVDLDQAHIHLGDLQYRHNMEVFLQLIIYSRIHQLFHFFLQ